MRNVVGEFLTRMLANPAMNSSPVHIPKVSGVSMLAVAVASLLSALFVGLVPTAKQTELKGRTWEQFARDDPEVAALYSMDLALLGGAIGAFAALAIVGDPVSAGRALGVVGAVDRACLLGRCRPPHGQGAVLSGALVCDGRGGCRAWALNSDSTCLSEIAGDRDDLVPRQCSGVSVCQTIVPMRKVG